MALNHRKMIIDSIKETKEENCESFCDPEKNPDGWCPLSCFSRCSQTSHIPLVIPQAPTPPPPSPPSSPTTIHLDKHHKLSPFLSLSIGLFSVTFFFFACYAIYKCYALWRRRRRRRRPETQPQEGEIGDEFLDEDQRPAVDHHIWYIRTVGLQPSVITAITVCKYKRGDGLVDGTECAVCLNEFQEDETLRLLPKCNHAFHLPCIDTWLRSHTNCPMCRAGIVINTAGLASPDPGVENSGLLDETQVGNEENNGGYERDREDEAGDELRIGIEEEGELRVCNGTRKNEISKEEMDNSDHLEVDEVQPVRRSVSLDTLSASMISLAVADAQPGQYGRNSSDFRLVESNGSNGSAVPKRVEADRSLVRSVASSSNGRSAPKRPVSMKRSFSYSGKVLLSRSSRSRNVLF